jgi:general secretion pathway protein G
VLRHDLSVVRESIDKYYADLGEYPEALAALVDKHYIRSVPVDPFTRSASTWLMVPSDDPDHPGVRDIHSGSPDLAFDGSPFISW